MSILSIDNRKLSSTQPTEVAIRDSVSGVQVGSWATLPVEAYVPAMEGGEPDGSNGPGKVKGYLGDYTAAAFVFGVDVTNSQFTSQATTVSGSIVWTGRETDFLITAGIEGIGYVLQVTTVDDADTITYAVSPNNPSLTDDIQKFFQYAQTFRIVSDIGGTDDNDEWWYYANGGVYPWNSEYPPVWSAIPDISFDLSLEPLVQDLSVYLVDQGTGENLVYSLTGEPVGITINASTGVLTIDIGGISETDDTFNVHATTDVGTAETTLRVERTNAALPEWTPNLNGVTSYGLFDEVTTALQDWKVSLVSRRASQNGASFAMLLGYSEAGPLYMAHTNGVSDTAMNYLASTRVGSAANVTVDRADNVPGNYSLWENDNQAQTYLLNGTDMIDPGTYSMGTSGPMSNILGAHFNLANNLDGQIHDYQLDDRDTPSNNIHINTIINSEEMPTELGIYNELTQLKIGDWFNLGVDQPYVPVLRGGGVNGENEAFKSEAYNGSQTT